jgi:hypothetical protein
VILNVIILTEINNDEEVNDLSETQDLAELSIHLRTAALMLA